MTPSHDAPSPSDGGPAPHEVPQNVVADATRVAAGAADRAGIEVRDVTDPAGHHEMVALFATVWQTDEQHAPVMVGTLRAASHVGSYVVGAFEGARMLGGAFAFYGDDGHLHSHVAGVLPGHRGRGIGFALKVHQRAWALQRGIDRVSWTFDPLVRRNAWFNLELLGVELTAYLPAFYGEMRDGINAGSETDRLYVEWRLASGRAATAVARARPATESRELHGRPGIAVVVEGADDGRPVTRAVPADATVHLVATPADVEELRASAPDVARAWRLPVRDALHTGMARGWQVTGMTRDGFYVVAAP